MSIWSPVSYAKQVPKGSLELLENECLVDVHLKLGDVKRKIKPTYLHSPQSIPHISPHHWGKNALFCRRLCEISSNCDNFRKVVEMIWQLCYSYDQSENYEVLCCQHLATTGLIYFSLLRIPKAPIGAVASILSARNRFNSEISETMLQRFPSYPCPHHLHQWYAENPPLKTYCEICFRCFSRFQLFYRPTTVSKSRSSLYWNMHMVPIAINFMHSSAIINAHHAVSNLQGVFTRRSTLTWERFPPIWPPSGLCGLLWTRSQQENKSQNCSMRNSTPIWWRKYRQSLRSFWEMSSGHLPSPSVRLQQWLLSHDHSAV